MRHLSLTILLFTAMGPAAIAAPVGWPSGTAPCNSTLQACIDGVGSGITIEIRTSTPINENLSINKSIGLEAEATRRVSLAPGRGITGTVTGSAPWNLTLRGLRLVNGSVTLTQAGSGAADLTLEDLRIESTAPGTFAGLRARIGSSAAASTVRITGNRLRVSAPSLFDAAIEVEFSGGTGHLADIRWNTIESRGVSDGWGILGSAINGTTAEFRMLGNEIRGEFQRDGIMVSEGLFSSTASTVTARIVSNVVIGEGGFSGGISSVVNQGNTSAQILNNTVVRADGIALSRWGGGGPPATGTTSGTIFNNLIAFNRWGLQNTAAAGGTATNDHNLLHRNVNPGAHTAGANDINADPLLRSLDAPRLGAGSPAIDAGNALALIGGGSLPLLDGDGLRRLVNGDGAGTAEVDIGAYEQGHRMLLARSNGTAANFFSINDPVASASNTSRLFTTLNRTVNPLNTNPRPTGVFFDSLPFGWSIFNQDMSAMSAPLAYNVFHPLPSTTLSMRTFTSALSGFPNAMALPGPINTDIVLAEQNWNGNGTSGVYNNHPIAVGREAGAWFLHNANGTAIPANAKFNVYYQPPSPNVFEVFKRSSDGLSNSAILLDHPLLNDAPCAGVVVTPTSATPAADPTGKLFDVVLPDTADATGERRWRIFSFSGSIESQRYHVLVVPEQISDCTKGPLFRDQFEP
jgi:hypothetical protein